jgi:hypothetical protein
MSLVCVVVIEAEHVLDEAHLLLPPPSIASELGRGVVVVVELVDEDAEEDVEVVEVVEEVVEEDVVVVEFVVVEVVALVVELVVVEETVVVDELMVVDELVDVDVVVVVSTENMAYLSKFELLDCFEYHRPVNVPLKVGGSVCLCEAVKPESIEVRGVQVDPISVERVAYVELDSGP